MRRKLYGTVETDGTTFLYEITCRNINFKALEPRGHFLIGKEHAYVHLFYTCCPIKDSLILKLNHLEEAIDRRSVVFILKAVKLWYRSFKICYKCSLQVSLYAVVAIQSPRNRLLWKKSLQSHHDHFKMCSIKMAQTKNEIFSHPLL